MSVDANVSTCELCALLADSSAASVVLRRTDYAVLLIDDAAYPGFCRVVWHAHVKEMSDLAPEQRAVLMDAVWQVEAAQREVLQPHKINLASLGNMTPHLHWHVIPRYDDDAHFPNPVWGAAVRATPEDVLATRRALLPALRAAIVRRLAA